MKSQVCIYSHQSNPILVKTSIPSCISIHINLSLSPKPEYLKEPDNFAKQKGNCISKFGPCLKLKDIVPSKVLSMAY